MPKKESGQSLVELALVLPVLLSLLLGTVEFGRVIAGYMIMNNLAREGARFAAVGRTDAQITTMLKEDHAWLDQDLIQVQFTPSYSNRVKGEPVMVKVSYPLDLLTPVQFSFLPNPLPIDAECTMRLE